MRRKRRPSAPVSVAVSVGDLVARAWIAAHGQLCGQQDSLDPFAYDREVYNRFYSSFEWAQFVTEAEPVSTIVWYPL